VAIELHPARFRAKPSATPIYVAGVVIALIGAALWAYLHFIAKGPAPDLPLTPEAKAYVRNLQLGDVGMKGNESYYRQLLVEITGKIGNTGGRNLELVEIYCVFYDPYGQMVLRKRVPIANRLKPGETKSFRLAFDEIPESWNHAMPQLVIAGIKFL
jgi:hypothetical protein